jgi:hypothetical protein
MPNACLPCTVKTLIKVGFNILLKFNRLHDLQLTPSVSFYQMLLEVGRRDPASI